MFLPANYKIPKQDSIFMKFKQGANNFRVITDVTLGYEYWNVNSKPVRMREMPDHQPEDLGTNDDGTLSSIKHFWAFFVIDREDEEIKLLIITQTGIMGQINDLLTSIDWDDPKDYDLTVMKKGEGKESRYSVQPSPKEQLTTKESALIEKTELGTDKLVFGTRKSEDEEVTDEEIAIENVSF